MTDQPQEFAPDEAVEAQDVADLDEPQEAEGAESTEPTPEPAPQKAWSDDDEEEARLFGWKAPTEWQGEKPPGYIDNPQEFLSRVQRSRIFQTMQEKQSEMARKLETVNAQAMERQRREYEAQLKQITQQQRRAVEEADTESFDRLEKQRQDMLRDAPRAEAEQQAVPPEASLELQDYVQKNEWAQDPMLFDEARRAVDFGLKTGQITSNSVADQLAYAEKRMAMKYPHLFQKQERPAPRQRVDGGGLGSGPARGNDPFQGLPKEAKDAFARFVKQGVFADTPEGRKEYADEYRKA